MTASNGSSGPSKNGAPDVKATSQQVKSRLATLSHDLLVELAADSRSTSSFHEDLDLALESVLERLRQRSPKVALGDPKQSSKAHPLQYHTNLKELQTRCDELGADHVATGPDLGLIRELVTYNTEGWKKEIAHMIGICGGALEQMFLHVIQSTLANELDAAKYIRLMATLEEYKIYKVNEWIKVSQNPGWSWENLETSIRTNWSKIRRMKQEQSSKRRNEVRKNQKARDEGDEGSNQGKSLGPDELQAAVNLGADLLASYECLVLHLKDCLHAFIFEKFVGGLAAEIGREDSQISRTVLDRLSE